MKQLTITTQWNHFEETYRQADIAGIEAGNKIQPIAMVVNEHSNPLNDQSDIVKSYYVADGVCGFAWLELKGNTSFGKWALAAHVARKGYPNGLAIWCHHFGQSMQRKTKWAHTVSQYLRDELQVITHVCSRMD